MVRHLKKHQQVYIPIPKVIVRSSDSGYENFPREFKRFQYLKNDFIWSSGFREVRDGFQIGLYTSQLTS